MAVRGQTRTRATCRITELPEADSTPDATPIPLAHMCTGSKAGWLTLQTAAVNLQDRVLARCSCGALTFFEAKAISSGAMRSCGSLDVHGRH